jgi:hypothetical protein
VNVANNVKPGTLVQFFRVFHCCRPIRGVLSIAGG